MIYTMGQISIQIGLPAQHVGWIYVNYMNRTRISEHRLAKWLYCAFPSATIALQIQKKMEGILSVVIRVLPVLTSFASLSKKHPETILVQWKCSIINSKFWGFKEQWLWSKKEQGALLYWLCFHTEVILPILNVKWKAQWSSGYFSLKKWLGCKACLTPFA